MKDRSRNTRLAPARPLVAWLVTNGADDPETNALDVVYAYSSDEARGIGWRRGDSGYDLKEAGFYEALGDEPASPDMLDVSRLRAADRFARSPGIEGEVANLRHAGIKWLGEDDCSKCGLSSTGEKTGPWAVCPDCYQCGECGCDCPELESASVPS